MQSPGSIAKHRRSWWRRLVKGVAITLVSILVLGTTYETYARAREARIYPPRGELVDVGGYRLHLNCTGEGDGPTVILENGSGARRALTCWWAPR